MIPSTIEPFERYANAAGHLCANLGTVALVVGFLAFLAAAWRGRALRRFAAGLRPGKGYSL